MVVLRPESGESGRGKLNGGQIANGLSDAEAGGRESSQRERERDKRGEGGDRR